MIKLLKRILLWSPKKKVSVKNLTPKKVEPTKLEQYQKFAEELLFTTDLDLENVLVHDLGKFGQAGRTYHDHIRVGYNDEFKVKIPHPDKPYIIVPEIKCWWTFRAWIHEIGHHMNKHYCTRKPKYIKEYEAEVYCVENVANCEAVTINDSVEIRFSAVSYLYSYVISAFENGELNYFGEIDNDIIEFLYYTNWAKDELERIWK
jgi:hypothetical protein